MRSTSSCGYLSVWMSQALHRGRTDTDRERYALSKYRRVGAAARYIAQNTRNNLIPAVHRPTARPHMLNTHSLTQQKAFEKCWAHSPLRAAARPNINSLRRSWFCKLHLTSNTTTVPSRPIVTREH